MDAIGLKGSLRAEKLNFNGVPHHAFNDAYNMTKIFIRYFCDWSFIKKETTKEVKNGR